MKRKRIQTMSKLSKRKAKSLGLTDSSGESLPVSSEVSSSVIMEFKEREVPPPEKRLCKKHGRPIFPSDWKHGNRLTGCASCSRIKFELGREKRSKRWKKETIFCKKHPERRCARTDYVRDCRRICNWCRHHRSNGSLRPSRKRTAIKSRNKISYRRALK